MKNKFGVQKRESIKKNFLNQYLMDKINIKFINFNLPWQIIESFFIILFGIK